MSSILKKIRENTYQCICKVVHLTKVVPCTPKPLWQHFWLFGPQIGENWSSSCLCHGAKYWKVLREQHRFQLQNVLWSRMDQECCQCWQGSLKWPRKIDWKRWHRHIWKSNKNFNSRPFSVNSNFKILLEWGGFFSWKRGLRARCEN